MKDKEVRLLFKEIFQEIAPEVLFEQVDTSRPLRDQIEIDSFDFYRIIVQISARTGVNIPDSKLTEMKNLDQLIEYVLQKTSEQSTHHRQL